MQSTALEPTSTSNLTLDAFNSVAALTNCTDISNLDPQSDATLSCLRRLPFPTLLNATITDHDSKSNTTDGDIYLPTVDHDFLPLPSSELTLRGRFPRIPITIGWTKDDATLFTPRTITTPDDTSNFLSTRWPALSNATITTLLSLYPTSDFPASHNRSAEFYRSAQLFRDILLVCPSFLFGHAMAQKYYNYDDNCTATAPPVYYYTQNSTILTPYLNATGLSGFGVIHTSELAYVFANFTPYVSGTEGLIAPTAEDDALRRREARSWSTFATTGAPSAEGKDTLEGWSEAYEDGEGMMDASVYVVGGGTPGMSGLKDGKGVLGRQKLSERCGFLNSEVIRELQY